MYFETQYERCDSQLTATVTLTVTLTFFVTSATNIGATMPGMDANVLEMANRMEEYLKQKYKRITIKIAHNVITHSCI